MLTGHRLSALENWQLGFVNRIAEHDVLLSSAYALAEQILSKAPLAIKALMATLRVVGRDSVADAFLRMRDDVPEYQHMLSSSDAEEGPLAFSEGRKPRWQGR
jgi:enoyl-CoA hydratase/carnithine racemase